MRTIKLIQESDKAAIYSPQDSDSDFTEYEKFLSMGLSLTEPILIDDFSYTITRINKMIEDCGIRENLFRLEGGRIKALPIGNNTKRKKSIGTIRLYCIRISDRILIIGNGCIKKVQKYEDDPNIKSIVDTLRKIDKAITKKANEKHIATSNYTEFKNLLETITIS